MSRFDLGHRARDADAAIAQSGDRHVGRAARENGDYHGDYSDGLLARLDARARATWRHTLNVGRRQSADAARRGGPTDRMDARLEHALA